ncbi:MAG: Serine/threonine protein kinase PrkC, regulator of stationary phase [Acidimicrobiales bacterium]|nr:Serine/threonine protein kinase PrkC, regulator of stationary phase [Acidimicrobiales bacterium]
MADADGDQWGAFEGSPDEIAVHLDGVEQALCDLVDADPSDRTAAHAAAASGRRALHAAAGEVRRLTERMERIDRTLVEARAELRLDAERQSLMQQRLVTQEKLASLGALTAGIAHEIRNPLNFVTNFALALVSLSEELDDLLSANISSLPAPVAEDLTDLAREIHETAGRVVNHGELAAGIVTSMLQHSHGAKAELRLSDVSALLAENGRLAYHGVRAQHPELEVDYEVRVDGVVPPVNVVAPDMGRVFLNVIGNAFDAVRARSLYHHAGYVPRVEASIRDRGDDLEVRVADNGIGIDAAKMHDVMTPFFTTKSPGEGTGLGLSISHDIVVGEHGGELLMESALGEGTTVRIVIPKR